MLRAAIGATASFSRLKVDVEAEFCRNHNLLADGLQSLAYQLFVFERAIRLSRVEERDFMIVSRANQMNHLGLAPKFETNS
jgi:hypothetical protein